VIFIPLGKGGPPNEGAKQGHPLKRRYSAAIGSSNVKMVANRQGCSLGREISGLEMY